MTFSYLGMGFQCDLFSKIVKYNDMVSRRTPHFLKLKLQKKYPKFAQTNSLTRYDIQFVFSSLCGHYSFKFPIPLPFPQNSQKREWFIHWFPFPRLRIYVREWPALWGLIFYPLFWMGIKNMSGSFFVPASARCLCKGPQDMKKFPQKCQKIAGCYECAVYGSQPPIASKPGSSPLERRSPTQSRQ